jgi:hypothetical protein
MAQVKLVLQDEIPLAVLLLFYVFHSAYMLLSSFCFLPVAPAIGLKIIVSFRLLAVLLAEKNKKRA